MSTVGVDPYEQNVLRERLLKWVHEKESARPTSREQTNEHDPCVTGGDSASLDKEKEEAEKEKERKRRRSMTPPCLIGGWEKEIRDLKEEISRLEALLYDATCVATP